MIEIIIANAVTGTFIIFAYTLGLKNGQKVLNNKPIEMPEIHPIKAIKKSIEENKLNDKMMKEYERDNTVGMNIENYTGSAEGQKKVI